MQKKHEMKSGQQSKFNLSPIRFATFSHRSRVRGECSRSTRTALNSPTPTPTQYPYRSHSNRIESYEIEHQTENKNIANTTKEHNNM